MEIKVLSQSKVRKELIENASQFFMKKLNLNFSTYTVYICTQPNLRKEDGVNGLCGRTGDKEITIALDSRLSVKKILYTLAHEMVHMKQYCRGQYRSEKSRNGKHKRFWLGKQVSVSYIKRPWEIEAFSRENILVEQLLAVVAQNMKNRIDEKFSFAYNTLS